MRERLCGKYTSMVFSSVSNSLNAGNAFNPLKTAQKSLTFSINIRDWRSPLERMMYCVRLLHALDHGPQSRGKTLAALPAPNRDLQLRVVLDPTVLVSENGDRLFRQSPK